MFTSPPGGEGSGISVGLPCKQNSHRRHRISKKKRRGKDRNQTRVPETRGEMDCIPLLGNGEEFQDLIRFSGSDYAAFTDLLQRKHPQNQITRTGLRLHLR